MRTRVLTLTAAWLLATATLATAQTFPTPLPAPTPNPSTPAIGTFDFGGIFGSVDGDKARYERYRDTRNGVFTDFFYTADRQTYYLDARANHIGYRDQRYSLDYDRNRLKFTFLWDSVPTNLLYGALSPWSRGGTVLTLNDDAQRDVQNRLVNGVPCVFLFPCTSLATAATALANPSIYNRFANRFDMRSRRDTALVGLTVNTSQYTDLHLKFATARREGEQPWGASHSFGNANEIPLPIDQRTNDFSAAFEWAPSKGLLRVAWDGQWFNNDIKSVTWDNPVRLTDFVSPTGSFDSSAYINSNGAAVGRLASWPNNSMHVVSVTGLYRLARRSTLNGTLSLASQDQNEALIPWTSNQVLATAAGLTRLPRNTAEAGARGVNALINFVSRPTRLFIFNARYRFNDRDVTTEEFDATSSQRFDGSTANHGKTHQFDVRRQNLDLVGTFRPAGFGALRVAYGYERYDRHGRGFSETNENSFRAAYDVVASQYYSVRAGVDVSRRRGEGFILAGTDYEIGPAGEQPGLRYYDEANRDRTRANVLFSVNPADVLSLHVNVSAGKDKFLADDAIPRGREQFGLMETQVTSWAVGADLTPVDRVTFGASYGRETFSGLQKARNANPPPDPTWTDPARNWTLDNAETVNTFTLYVNALQVADNVDVRAGWDFSDSDISFAFDGPRVAALLAAGQFIPLPNVTNSWQRVWADVRYFFTRNVGLGVGYYYEKLDIEDWATIDTNGPVLFAPATGVPRLDYLGGLMTGYGNRPYDGQNVYVRLLYRF